MEEIDNSEVVEDLLCGKLKVIQKKDGYRFSIDAVLLSNFVNVKKNNRIIDLGTGCGVMPLILSWKNPENDIVGVEINEAVAAMAKRSIKLNDLSKKISIETGDIKEIKKLINVESFDLALSNPPYGKSNAGKISRGAEKATARHEILGSLNDFIAAASFAVKYRGRIFIIFPAKRLVDLITTLKENSFEPKRMRLVHSRKGEVAKLVLMEGLKGGRGEMEVLAPLYIYDNDGQYMQEVEEMYN